MVIAYDVTSKKTFGNVDKWKEKVEERNEDNLEDLVTVLVGCKADLGDIREVGGFCNYLTALRLMLAERRYKTVCRRTTLS